MQANIDLAAGKASSSAVPGTSTGAGMPKFMNPALAQHFGQGPPPKVGAGGVRDDGGLDAAEDPPEAIVQAAREALERELGDVEIAAASSDFFIRYRGAGAWGSVLADGMLATEAKRGTPRMFCTIYKLAMSATFDIAMLTPEVASVLAAEWIRKIQFFFNMWREIGDNAYVFTQADVAQYEPSSDFTEFIATPGMSDLASKKVRLIYDLSPH